MLTFFAVLLASCAGSRSVDPNSDASQPQTTVTLYDVTGTTEPSDDSRSLSRTVFAVGTASGGSETTYSERIVEYETKVSGSAAATITSTWEGIRVESASGYVRIHSNDDISDVQSCSFDGNQRGGCIEVVNHLGATIVASSSTITLSASTSTATLHASEATVMPVYTLAASAPSETSNAPAPASSGAQPNRNIIGPAVGGTLGGVALIITVLTAYLMCRRRRRRQNQERSRQLGFTSKPELPSGEYNYHYRQSRVAVPSMIESSTASKEGVSPMSSFDPYTSPPKMHYLRSRSPSHSPTHSESFVSPFRSRQVASPSPLSTTPPTRPYMSQDMESLSSVSPPPTADTSASQNTAVASPVPRQPQLAPQDSHPGHNFRIHPSRFIERLSLSSVYLESLVAGGPLASIPNESKLDSPVHDLSSRPSSPLSYSPRPRSPTSLDIEASDSLSRTPPLHRSSMTPHSHSTFQTAQEGSALATPAYYTPTPPPSSPSPPLSDTSHAHYGYAI
ncbi:hypothetical protein Moror_12552 [Moniliophthora roreri MCA 2997]|uniref:Uncharacterized protein n=2 Tax=Moniliophthora roreri TaxID=221103 RepID=V2XT49_MONRO|nr:hypothetical protein Moror_12552 [Moniliophthora roreri MCA 2997]KAI3621331.1 hypothetical protein WG66_014429 [Moniliophthora roreri]